ncbi:MAG TPA: hypothetical protein VHQ47_01520 [Phycisphaerae bacterium]|nr:hypothetical protein [Phycisphaerae bacterium]
MTAPRLSLLPTLLLPLLLAAGLASCTDQQAKKPVPVEYMVTSPYPPGHVLAVAPAANLSGSRDFDPLVVSDTLYAEMQQVRGLTALPLNKTLLAMHKLNLRSINSPEAAEKVAAALNADGIIIPAITAYDPYNPPLVGMTLELYNVMPASAPGAMSPAAADSAQPDLQVSAVFNATNESVLRELRDFAQGRTQADSAFGDQKFLVDSDAYMRFVCHAMVRRLMEVQRTRPSDR